MTDYNHVPFTPSGTRRVRYHDGGELRSRYVAMASKPDRFVRRFVDGKWYEFRRIGQNRYSLKVCDEQQISVELRKRGE